MTIKEVIDYVDEIKPNAFSNATKTIWLNEVEGQVMTEVFLLNEREVFEYHYASQDSTAITFPDTKTLGIADKNVRRKFQPGGKITMSPGGIYSDNAVTGAVIQAVNADGLVFAENTFSVTGTTEVTATLNYDGSGVELLVEPPHHKLYGQYLIAMIDYANGEYDKYANTMQMFNAFWGEFMRWFARVYAPANRHRPPEVRHELR